MSAKLKNGLLLLGVLIGIVVVLFGSEVRLYLYYRDLYQQVTDPNAPSVFQEDGAFTDYDDRFSPLIV